MDRRPVARHQLGGGRPPARIQSWRRVRPICPGPNQHAVGLGAFRCDDVGNAAEPRLELGNRPGTVEPVRRIDHGPAGQVVTVAGLEHDMGAGAGTGVLRTKENSKAGVIGYLWETESRFWPNWLRKQGKCPA